jgi:hypothetical protein
MVKPNWLACISLLILIVQPATDFLLIISSKLLSQLVSLIIGLFTIVFFSNYAIEPYLHSKE